MSAVGYDLLNDYTKAVLIAAAAVAPTLVHGLYLKVSADSDVVLHRPDGHWVGIRLRTAWTEPTWEAWRGFVRLGRSRRGKRGEVRCSGTGRSPGGPR